MSQTGPEPLVTGEAVALDLRVAALPSRAVARLLDGVVQVALLIALGLLVGVVAGGSSEALAAALGVVVLVLVLLVYPIVQETLLRGRTVGKMAMGLRAVRDDGGPVAFRQALVRGLSVLVDVPTGFSVSVLCMLLHPRSKRLGDLLAGTVVVQERVASSGASAAVMPAPLEGWARTLDLSRLSDDLALQVRAFTGRAGELRPEAREDLGGRLVAAVQAATSPPPPPGTPGWAYLAAVLAERRRRDGERYAGAAATRAAASGGLAGSRGTAGPGGTAGSGGTGETARRDEGQSPGAFAPPS